MQTTLKVHNEKLGNLATVRTFKLPASSTVAEALAKVAVKEGIAEDQVSNYGLFLPTSRGAPGVAVGWWPLDATLSALHIVSGCEVDFRMRSGRKVTVWDAKLESATGHAWMDEASGWLAVSCLTDIGAQLPVKRNLVSVCRDMARRNVLSVMPAGVARRVVTVSKSDLLLNYTLPDQTDFAVSLNEGFVVTSDASDEELVDNCLFHVCTPAFEGELWKKSASGFWRGWKKMWCVLQRDVLLFYSERGAPTHASTIHIRTVEFCHQSEPIDSHSKKLGHIFKIGTNSADKVVYVGVAQREALIKWMSAIDRWTLYLAFFKPKAITERGFALSHILSGQVVRPNPKTHPSAASGIRNRSESLLRPESSTEHSMSLPLARVESVAAAEDARDPLEVQPNREISVLLADGSSRAMVVDSRLDVYELAYMIAEEVQSCNAFVLDADDFGPARGVELLDHQLSLASQQIPLSAKFSIRKTGIVDDFVRENDIYDNHFLFVTLPALEDSVLLLDAVSNTWMRVQLRLVAGKLCAVSEDNSDLAEAVIPMSDISAFYQTAHFVQDASWADYAFAVVLTNNEELCCLARTPDIASDWCAVDGWCGFHRANPLLDPTEQYSAKLAEKGQPVTDVNAWLGIQRTPVAAPSPVAAAAVVAQTAATATMPAVPHDGSALATSQSPSHSATNSSVSPREDNGVPGREVLTLYSGGGGGGGGAQTRGGGDAGSGDDEYDREQLSELMDLMDRSSGDDGDDATDSEDARRPPSGRGRLVSSDTSARLSHVSPPPQRMQTPPSSSEGSLTPPPAGVSAAATASSSPAGRIRNFNWRAKQQSSGSQSRARRRSMDELTMDAPDDTTVDEPMDEPVVSASLEEESEDPIKVESDESESSTMISGPVVVEKSPRRMQPAPVAVVIQQPKPAVAATPAPSGAAAASPPTMAAVAPDAPSRAPPQRAVPPEPSAEQPVSSDSPSQLQRGGKHHDARPPLEISRLIRRAYESIEAVKMKVLPDADPSVYLWKVLHSANLQKVGYATAVADHVVFFDLRGREVLRVASTELLGLPVPASRKARVDKLKAQARKSSNKRDALEDMCAVYGIEGRQIVLRPARDAEFEYRVMSDAGQQVGWASRRGTDTLFFDMNGKRLAQLATSALSLSSQSAAASTDPREAARAVFKASSEVVLRRPAEGVKAPFQFRACVANDAQVGWVDREAFTFVCYGLDGDNLGRLPLAAFDAVASLPTASASGAQTTLEPSRRPPVPGQSPSPPPGAAPVAPPRKPSVGDNSGSFVGKPLPAVSAEVRGEKVLKRTSSGGSVRSGVLGRIIDHVAPKEDKKSAALASSSGALPRSLSSSGLPKASVVKTPEQRHKLSDAEPGRVATLKEVSLETASTRRNTKGAIGTPEMARRLAEEATEGRVRGNSGASRRLSEWQGKTQPNTSASMTSVTAAATAVTTRTSRKGSYDYAPDGLSPALKTSGYDPASQHRPMGLAGLLDLPDDGSDEDRVDGAAHPLSPKRAAMDPLSPALQGAYSSTSQHRPMGIVGLVDPRVGGGGDSSDDDVVAPVKKPPSRSNTPREIRK